MLIHDALERAQASGTLTRFVSPVRGAPPRRVFLMTGRLMAQFDEARSSPDPKRVERWERLAADIAYFIENGRVSWAFMKWLEPRKFEHWELRSVRPRPSLRVFGRFAAPDMFIATHAAERAPLGAKWSLQWELEKLTCEEEWEAALPRVPPFRGERYEDYITENVSIFPRIPA